MLFPLLLAARSVLALSRCIAATASLCAMCSVVLPAPLCVAGVPAIIEVSGSDDVAVVIECAGFIVLG